MKPCQQVFKAKSKYLSKLGCNNCCSLWDINVHTIKIKQAITKLKHCALVSKVWTVFALANFDYI